MNAQNFLSKEADHPYASLFLIAILYCLLGVLIWPVSFYLGYQSDHIILFHKLFMFGGFLGTFADGFFLTAFSGFTRTKKIKKYYLGIIYFCKFFLLISLFVDNIYLGLCSYLLSTFFVICFVVKRYFKRSGLFPSSLYFVFFALVCGATYFALQLYSLYFEVDLYMSFQDTLLQVLFPLNLILGVGLKIIPVFFGLPTRGCFSISAKKESKLISHFKDNKFNYIVVLFNLSVILDYFEFIFFASLFRVFLLSYIFVNQFKILERPKVLSFITSGMRFALWMILIGLTLRSFESMAIFGAHIYFISGIVIFTFMVASRITLSHSGFSLDFERQNKSIHLVVLFLFFSSLLRFLPRFVDFFSFEHFILCAFISLLIAISIWFKIYGAKLIAPLKRR